MKRANPAAKAGHPATILFLHGLGGSSADWKDVISFLHPRFRGVAIDLPGSSLSAVACAEFSPALLADWLLAVLEQDGLGRPHVVAHSLGARIAGELAARRPEAMASLLMVAPLGAAGYPLADRLKWKAMSRTAILRNVSESQMRRAVSYGFVSEGAGKRGFVERALAARTGGHATATTSAIEKSVDGVLGAPPLTERLRATRIPLGLVVGSEDPLVPPDEAEKLLLVRKDARLFRLAGQGHYPMLDDPRGFARVVESFLDR